MIVMVICEYVELKWLWWWSMASNPARKYCDLVEGRASASKCKFCGHIMGGGGITRVKNHLTNVDKTKGVKLCDKVPPRQMRELLYGNSQKKK